MEQPTTSFGASKAQVMLPASFAFMLNSQAVFMVFLYGFSFALSDSVFYFFILLNNIRRGRFSKQSI